jgi:hypothetical protein
MQMPLAKKTVNDRAAPTVEQGNCITSQLHCQAPVVSGTLAF